MDILEFLTANDVPYERRDHEPVFTCEDVRRLLPDFPGAETKNLFIRDDKGRRHFLLVVSPDKRVDLKAVPALLGVSKVSMASEKRLKEHLNVDPGAVSLLAIIHDQDKRVEVVVDKELWQAKALQFHPMTNTATLSIAREHLERFLALTEHPPRVLDIPIRAT